jgi:hypothetical protein
VATFRSRNQGQPLSRVGVTSKNGRELRPNLCGSGDTPREAAEDLIRRMTNEKDFHGDTWHGESVEQAIAEVRTFLEKSA